MAGPATYTLERLIVLKIWYKQNAHTQPRATKWAGYGAGLSFCLVLKLKDPLSVESLCMSARATVAHSAAAVMSTAGRFDGGGAETSSGGRLCAPSSVTLRAARQKSRAALEADGSARFA